MDTSNLMSSLREMMAAEVKVQLLASGLIHANQETRGAAAMQYSRHETVVREELAKLGAEASRYKPEPRMR